MTISIGLVIGFGAGALWTSPDRKETGKKINEANKEKSLAIKQKDEIIEYNDKLKNEILRFKEALKIAHKTISDLKADLPAQKSELNTSNNLTLKSNLLTEKPQNDLKTKTTNTKIFGVVLGENLQDLQKRLPISMSGLKYEDIDHPGIIWNVEYLASGIKSVNVSTYQDKIYNIIVYFSDTSEMNLKVIRDELVREYRSIDKDDGIFGELFGEASFEVTIDGIPVYIKLNRDMGIMDDNKLTIEYTHKPIYKEVIEKIKHSKSVRFSEASNK